MKRTLLLKSRLAITSLIFAAATLCGHAQGSYNFVNPASAQIQIQYYPGPPHAATYEENTFVEFLWAPIGVTDFSLFQVHGSKVRVGVPVAGRFSAGVRTIPAGTGFFGIAPGDTVNAVVRAWFGPEDSDWNNRYWGDYSTLFTVDTGDTTAVPAGVPGSLVFGNPNPFTGVIITIPEPATGGLLMLAVLVGLGHRSLAKRPQGKC